ncbi:MAG: glycosyltransferase family 39 protein [Candidatus Baltobacteraceae bacterium]
MRLPWFRQTAFLAAAAAFVVHAAANPHYGFFRDELYFIICGRHPQWGYVDQPPVVPLLSALTQVLGPSLFLLRLVPAACAAAAVFAACRLSEEFGGKTFALLLAATGTFFAPELLSFGMKSGTDEIGMWAWPIAVLFIARVRKGADPRWWLAAGAVIGLAFEAKYSALFFGIAAVAALLLAPGRRVLFTPWFAAGAALAILIALPNALWQAHYGFPMIELLRNGQHGKNVMVSPQTFLLLQLLVTNPLLSLIWLTGLVWALSKPDLRWIAYLWAILMALMIAAHGKMYYPGDVYPVAFALGGVALERLLSNAALRAAALGVAVAAGIAMAPLVLPILSEPDAVAYGQGLSRTLHINAPKTEHHRSGPLSDDFADMHGWPQLAQTVASLYDALPPDEKRVAAIAASNYGEAAAIDFFGAAYGLPPAISGHNQYFLWGTHGYSGEVLIDIDGDCGAGMHLYRSARRAAVFSAPWAIAYEQGLPIMVCRGIDKPLQQIWTRVKNYN